MAWDVIGLDEFRDWYQSLTDAERDDIDPIVDLLVEYGPTLKFPHSSGIAASAYSQMRELRIQHAGRPYRILYAFDPTRSAVLLLGGDKTGDDRWYEVHVPKADKLFARYLNG